LAKDFAAVSQASSHFLTLYHHPTLKVGSVSELIAHARANPGKLAFGSAGAGSVQHLAWELFAHMAAVKLMHVPYKGGAHAMTAALSGEVQMGFTSLMSVRPHISADRLRLLAITAKNRSSIAPELPTVWEAGVPGFVAEQWYGVVTRANVPPPVLRKLNAGILEALKSPDVVQRFTVDGITPLGSTAQEFTALIHSDIRKWRKLIADARLVLN
jgi:tripartite-type tricarboxylate transporter receptor subunit TctC